MTPCSTTVYLLDALPCVDATHGTPWHTGREQQLANTKPLGLPYFRQISGRKHVAHTEGFRQQAAAARE